MANVYTLTLNSIGIDPNDNTKLKTLSMTVTGTGAGTIKDLFQIHNTSDDSEVLNSVSDPVGDVYTITFNTSLANTESIRVQIVDDINTQYSDRMFIDFNAAVSSGSIDFNYKIPSEIGDYKMTLDIPSVSSFGSVETTNSITVSDNKPADANSSVTIAKPYLTYFAGDTVTLSATIHDSSDANADGNYEFSISGDLQ